MILNKKRILNIIALAPFQRTEPVKLLTEAQEYTEVQLLTGNDIRQIVKSTDQQRLILLLYSCFGIAS